MAEKINVIGAGMSGLLAAAMLRSELGTCYEKQDALPNNHSAVLRFRSSVVGDTLNIPFKKVQAMKAIEPHRNPIADALSYSKKTNGAYTLRSVATAKGEIVERYIAPKDFIQKMADRVKSIEFGVDYFGEDFPPDEIVPTISTIPMPALMQALGYREGLRPNFDYRKSTNIVMQIADCNAYASLYVPDPSSPISRISLTGDELVAECSHNLAWQEGTTQEVADVAMQAAAMMGIEGEWVLSIRPKEQSYAKILPCDERLRRRFIVWATDKFKIYSLGRYATWRPGLLQDDVVDDVRKIQEMIRSDDDYGRKLNG